MEAAEEREANVVIGRVGCTTPFSRLLADLREIHEWLLDPDSAPPGAACDPLKDNVLHIERTLRITSQVLFEDETYNDKLYIVALVIQKWVDEGSGYTSSYTQDIQSDIYMCVDRLVNGLADPARFVEFNQRCYALAIDESDPRGLQAAAMGLMSTSTKAAAGSAAKALRAARRAARKKPLPQAADEKFKGSVADLDAGAIESIFEFADDRLQPETAPTGGSCTLDALPKDMVEPFVDALLEYQKQRACKGEFNSLFGFGRRHSKTNKLFACDALIDSLRDETLPLDTRLCAALEQGQLGKITMGFNNLYAAIKNRGGQASLTGRG